MKLADVILQQTIKEIDEWDKDLTYEIQGYLAELGLYPLTNVDGIIGSLTKGGFAEFKRINKQNSPNILGAGSARLLVAQSAESRLSYDYAVTSIKESEGCSLSVYPDPLTKGKPYTVGYGSTRTPDGKEWVLGQTITQHQAEELLLVELKERIVKGCRKIPCWITLKAEQQAALLSFAYNVGPNFYGGANFNTITAVLREERLSDVPEALMLYVNPGSNVEAGLRARRKREGQLWMRAGSNVLQQSKIRNSLADKIVACCDERRYQLDRRPNCVNIVGVEGLNINGTKNNDAPDGWNDVVGLLTFLDNKPQFLCLYQGTTEPGIYYTDNPLNPKGAARLQLGQHKELWRVGAHRGYEAMQQVGAATLVRDSDKDHIRDDKVSVESHIGINLHTTKTTNWRGSAGNTVGRWSAGCVVIKDPSEFLQFMKKLKESHQYRSLKSAKFTFTLLWKEWI